MRYEGELSLPSSDGENDCLFVCDMGAGGRCLHQARGPSSKHPLAFKQLSRDMRTVSVSSGAVWG